MHVLLALGRHKLALVTAALVQHQDLVAAARIPKARRRKANNDTDHAKRDCRVRERGWRAETGGERDGRSRGNLCPCRCRCRCHAAAAVTKATAAAETHPGI